MKIVVFGLSISSAWGNGHATLLRGLFRALHERGHQVHFFEKDAPYYAAHRDAGSFSYVTLHLYSDFAAVREAAMLEIASADIAMVTSYCPDGAEASELVLSSQAPRKLFYDMDTPVTLQCLARGEAVSYLPPAGLGDFDLVLSYTGGEALTQLRRRLGAKKVAALYGWVDPGVYYPVPPSPAYLAAFSYLGTYAADRQAAFDNLFLQPAQSLPDLQFTVGGAMYPNPGEWPRNIRHYEHVPPNAHRQFYSSAPLTLSITRGSMAAMGFCPSGRLFEAAACGTAVLTDSWTGLDLFFEPGREILTAASTADVLQSLREDHAFIRLVAARARERVLDCHTAGIRAQRLLQLADRLPDESANSHLEEIAHVGNHTGRGNGIAHPAPGLLERTAARR